MINAVHFVPIEFLMISHLVLSWNNYSSHWELLVSAQSSAAAVQKANHTQSCKHISRNQNSRLL